MTGKLQLARELLTGPLVPPYAAPEDLKGAVAVVATPFNCYLRGQEPDKTNEAIARLAARYMAQFNLPFIGQWEQTNLLELWGHTDYIEFDSRDGERVESQRLAKFQAEHVLKRGRGNKVIRVGMPEHLGRCVALDRYFGLNPIVPADCAEVPYDDRERPGAQRWCKSRNIFVPYERLIARPGTVGKIILGVR